LSSNYTAGEDAIVELDGETLIRSSNTFSVAGVNYTLLKETEGTSQENITLTLDVDKIYENIKTFVESYNELLGSVNTKLSETYDRDYPPLTDEQKEAMEEKQIEQWEKAAKTGLLRNDSTLEVLATNMRRAMYDSIEGVSSSLAAIGISSGSYTDKGKLYIDETKLKEAIKNDPDSVVSLFSQESETHPGTTAVRKLSSSERTVRYNESGITYKLFDIIEDNISIITDSGGNKGALLVKAGTVGDTSEFTNALYKQIQDYNKQISTLLDSLSDKEDGYYRQYSALEKALSSMNSQSDWLASQLGAQ